MNMILFVSALQVLSFALTILHVSGQSPQRKINSTEPNIGNKYYEQIHTIKLEGNATMMYYYMNVYVGVPPQRQTLIVDTGSYLMAFPCSDCKGQCGNHIDRQYDPYRSSTSQKVTCDEKLGTFQCNNCDRNKQQCNWNIGYAEGSTLRGYVMKDYVTLGDEIQNYLDHSDGKDTQLLKFINHERINMAFGCTTTETNLFLTQEADGIIGLSPSTNNRDRLPNIVDENFRQHSDNNELLAFSLCFGRTTGGYMSIGGYNSQRHLVGEKTHIVDYTDSDGFYNIELFKIKMDGVDVGFSKSDLKNPFIDSGTTLFFGPRNLILKMYEKFSNTCKEDGRCLGDLTRYPGSQGSFQQICYRYNPLKASSLTEFFDSFPSITFQLQNDFEYQWHASSYFFIDPEHKKEQGLYCLGFEPYPTDRIYLGGTWMREYDILFDREHRKIHFTRANCSDGDNLQNNKELISQGDALIATTQDDEKLIRTFFGYSYLGIIFSLFVAVPFIVLGLHFCYKRQQLLQNITHDQLSNQNQNGNVQSPEGGYDTDANLAANSRNKGHMQRVPQQDEEALEEDYTKQATRNGRNLDDQLESEEETELGYQNKEAEYHMTEDQRLNDSVDDLRREAFAD